MSDIKILKHDNITEKYLKDYSFKTAKNNLLFFIDEDENVLTINVVNKNIIIQGEKDGISRSVTITYPKDDKDSVKCDETIIEKRENGIIVEKVLKIYGYTRFSNEVKYLTDIHSKRYVLGRESNLLANQEFLEKQALLITEFYCGMKHLISDGNRFYTDSATTVIAMLNDCDISKIYAIVDGPNKVEKVYDLYNGKVTEENLYDLLSINLGLLSKDAYDYKDKAGISLAEDFLIGESSSEISESYRKLVMDFVRDSIKYPYEFDLTNREEFIKVLDYSPKAVDVCKSKIENILGISYQDFNNLDWDAQQELIKEARTKAGLTKYEYERKRDKKIHDLFYKKSAVKEKIKSIFRKN